MSIHVIFAILLLIVVLKIGVWKNWKTFYSTILFFVLGNLMYRFIYEDKLLWTHYSTYFSEKQVELVWMFIIYPCTILLCLTFYMKQKTLSKKVYCILFWILLYSAWELILFKLGRIVYSNGWNYYWSVGFNFFMFPNLVLHHFKPLWSIIATFIFAIIFMFIFLGSIYI